MAGGRWQWSDFGGDSFAAGNLVAKGSVTADVYSIDGDSRCSSDRCIQNRAGCESDLQTHFRARVRLLLRASFTQWLTVASSLSEVAGSGCRPP